MDDISLRFSCGWFFFGALQKLANLEGFIVAIAAYVVLKNAILIRILGYILAIVEMGLGMALILYPKQSIFNILTLLLLVGFSGLISYSWIVHGLEDCGCLGSYIKMGPCISLLKKVLLAIMLFSSLYLKKSYLKHAIDNIPQSQK